MAILLTKNVNTLQKITGHVKNTLTIEIFL